MNLIPLPQLSKHQTVRIHSIVQNTDFGDLDEIVSRRLSDLGFSAGTTLELIAVGVLGKGPYAVRLNGLSQFSLRAAEAQKIMCESVEVAA